jgi:hypothetical protein
MRALLLGFLLVGCNSLTGTSGLEAVDCIGDCRRVPGPWCGIEGACEAGVCCVSGECAEGACTCSGTCGASAATFACDGDEDCAGAGHCCASVSLARSGAECSVTVSSTSCSACGSTFSTCSGTPLARLCHTSSECEGDDRCCVLRTTGGGSIHACAPSGFALSTTCFP